MAIKRKSVPPPVEWFDEWFKQKTYEPNPKLRDHLQRLDTDRIALEAQVRKQAEANKRLADFLNSTARPKKLGR